MSSGIPQPPAPAHLTWQPVGSVERWTTEDRDGPEGSRRAMVEAAVLFRDQQGHRAHPLSHRLITRELLTRDRDLSRRVAPITARS
jgi:hypothetical protein